MRIIVTNLGSFYNKLSLFLFILIQFVKIFSAKNAKSLYMLFFCISCQIFS